MRKASVWAFSAFFGCISLLGPGWHCFVGHGFHGHEFHGHGRGEHEVHAHAGHASGHCHEHDEHAAGHEVVAESAAAGQATDELAISGIHDHDCPICRFFAQSQWAFELPTAEHISAVWEVSPSSPVEVPLARMGLYRSRAPPSIASVA